MRNKDNLKIRIIILSLLIISFGAIASPGEAALCRNVDGHRICAVKIKRSAKYYWEYRTIISVDGQKQPMEIYNCRDRTVTRKNRYPIPLKSSGLGDLICSKFS